MTTTEEECLEALHEAGRILGKSPTKAEYEELGLTPASGTIMRKLGGWNEAKREAGLETFAQGENAGMDVQEKPDWVDIPDGVTWDELSAQQRWYYRNREHRIKVKERRRHEFKRWFYELKRDEYSCENCSEGRPPALDFHHEDEKYEGVASMVNDGYSKSRILSEAERCTVLCANCHRKEHYDGPGLEKLPPREDLIERIESASKHEARRLRRKWVASVKCANGGCVECGERDPATLDIHHTGEKQIRISLMVSMGDDIRTIAEEMENCEILCANCHRAEHHTPPDQLGQTDSV